MRTPGSSSDETEKKQTDVQIPTTEQAVVDMIEDDGEKTEQQKNLAIVQTRMIGDLDITDTNNNDTN